MYQSILEFEQKLPFYNQKPISSEELIYHTRSKICILEDSSIQGSAITLCHGRPTIYYNPIQPETYLTVGIGHEIGHYKLGHIKEDQVLFSNLFSYKGIDKDAGIVGFLFWMPTPRLRRLEAEKQVNIEEVFRLVKLKDPDLTDAEALRFSKSRVRIYNALRRVENNYIPISTRN